MLDVLGEGRIFFQGGDGFRNIHVLLIAIVAIKIKGKAELY
jgi:hypothetical protein